jgi:hypothetical protein
MSRYLEEEKKERNEGSKKDKREEWLMLMS